MKKVVFIFLLIICVCVVLKAQYTLNDIPYSLVEINQRDELGRKQGVWYIYDKETKLIYEVANYSNDTLNGHFEYYWHTTGNVSSKGYFKHGKIDSLHIAYWENGQERGRAYYENGLLNGVAITHDKSGNLTSKIRYINGKRDSTYTDMYIDPNIEWDNDHPIKIDTIYTQEMNGKYEKYAIYRNDELIQVFNLEDGIKKNETFYNTSKDYKRIIYCTKKPYGIRKIFYFKNHTLVKTDLVNDKCKCNKM